MIKRWLHDTLGFTKTEANGTLVLLTLVLITLIAPRVYFSVFREKNDWDQMDSEELNKWKDKIEASLTPVEEEKSKRNTVKSLTPFEFDPNTITTQDLKRIGLSPALAQRVDNYRNSGAVFNEPKDFQKIYGLSEHQYKQLEPYIKIVKDKFEKVPKSKNTFDLKELKDSPMSDQYELNTATSEELQELRGIGPVLSDRIIKFRDKLGGFHEKKQVDQVYGLSDLAKKSLDQKTFLMVEQKRININTDSIKHLSNHPYISFSQARAIVNYRINHGDYNELFDLLKIHIIDSVSFTKMQPYLSIAD